jgi:oxygen-independent coproporphyrinogen-3 oxidase
VHIPFCVQRCRFCDFAVVAGRRQGAPLVDGYLSALKTEIARAGEQLRDAQVNIETIQVGGGTPTFLSANALEDLLTFMLEQFDCPDVKEIVVEGFPTSITEAKLSVFEQFPMLRLNIGIQTFHNDILRAAGRSHTGSDAMESLVAATGSSIRDVGADIIFGLPGSSVQTVIADLEMISEAGVEHLAFYPLWVYEGTAFDSLLRRGVLEASSAELREEQLAAALEALEARGYERYSAFHYAKTVAHRHLYGQWQMLANNWIGFGMSAMTHIDGTIWFNERGIAAYIAAATGKCAAGPVAQTLSAHERMRFSFMYGLRLEAFPAASFADRFGTEITDVFSSEIETFERRGWVTESDGTIGLTPAGILNLGEIEQQLSDERPPSAAGTAGLGGSR